jgi:hypothetical protein
LLTATNTEDLPMTFSTRIAAAFLFFAFAQSHALLAQSGMAGETLRTSRSAGAPEIADDLSDQGWKGTEPVTTWYEANPGFRTVLRGPWPSAYTWAA